MKMIQKFLRQLKAFFKLQNKKTFNIKSTEYYYVIDDKKYMDEMGLTVEEFESLCVSNEFEDVMAEITYFDKVEYSNIKI